MVLGAGDVAWVELNPTLGTEQAGRRPGLILSDAGYNERTGRVLVCPITRSPRPWTFHVPIPPGLKVEGMVMVDQVRMLDGRLRVFDYVDTLPAATLAEVRGRLANLAGILVGTDLGSFE
jgi:mRNA interferase MazF